MNIRLLAASSVVLAAVSAGAQYAQPYNPNDPQNYSAPAAQQYQGQQNAGQRYDPNSYDANGVQQPQQPYYGDQGQQQDIQQAPPPLPEYDQPEAPGDGYIWTPGYWAFGNGGYYWVQGAWVAAPYEGALWTPGYWGYGGGGYFWNVGYWGPTVGYYGGINYGFGYFGTGFYGGYWNGGRFFYNRAYARGRFGYGYNQPYRGFRGGYAGGRSFTTVTANGGAFRGGYNQRGVAGAQLAYGNRGSAPGQSFGGRPTYNNGASGFNHATAQPSGGYTQQRGFSAPQQQGYQQRGMTAPPQQRGFTAPQQRGNPAPQRSAPSSGSGSHTAAPSGGGSRGGHR